MSQAGHRTAARSGRGRRSAVIALPRRRSRHAWWAMLVLLLALLGAASVVAAQPHSPGGADELGGQLDADRRFPFRSRDGPATRTATGAG